MFFVWSLFVIIFVCGFECYELSLVTCVQPVLGTWWKEDWKCDSLHVQLLLQVLFPTPNLLAVLVSTLPCQVRWGWSISRLLTAGRPGSWNSVVHLRIQRRYCGSIHLTSSRRCNRSLGSGTLRLPLSGHWRNLVWKNIMTSWGVWTVSGKGKTLFIVAGLDFIILTLTTNAHLGVSVVLLLSS